MADHLATVAVRFAIVLGVFLFGITTLWLGRQAWRGFAWCWRRVSLRKDSRRLDWLQELDGDFHNIDRITSVGGRFNRHESLRAAIDAAMKHGGEDD